MPDAPRETFISHITVSTGHHRRSYRKEVENNVVELLKSWLPDLFAGQTRGIIEDKYAVRCDWHNSKSAGFTVMRVDDRLAGVDLIKFSVCRHSKKSAAAWEFVGGRSEIPSVPFVAVALIDANITFEDLGFIPAIADFERCLAWAWMEL
ncbi:hypothetical protein BV912_06395 [Neisseria dumasiana]|uniref:Uncharacterized protein n=1 Tax=Neisseria dumasiana TaxID=1931275 RepID=A0A1X3DIT8_9NEIS|nr:hypothetical protein BV912_06395 [Neisseria dumasiana]